LGGSFGWLNFNDESLRSGRRLLYGWRGWCTARNQADDQANGDHQMSDTISVVHVSFLLVLERLVYCRV